MGLCSLMSVPLLSSRTPAGLHFVKRLAGLGKTRGFTGILLPALYDHVAVQRIDFDETGLAAGLLGREHGGPRTPEGVQHDVAPLRTVAQGVHHHGRRL